MRATEDALPRGKGELKNIEQRQIERQSLSVGEAERRRWRLRVFSEKQRKKKRLVEDIKDLYPPAPEK